MPSVVFPGPTLEPGDILPFRDDRHRVGLGPRVPITGDELGPGHLQGTQQIGEHLFVSQATVKTHVLSIYRKFGVSSRDEAVEHARLLGLVDAPLLS